VALTIDVRDIGEVRVLELNGRLALGDDSKSFRDRVRSLVQAGKKKIVLNLSQVHYIDSSGIAMLVASSQIARSQGATLKLANVSPKITEVLNMTKLTPVFDIYENEATAVASFA
jgi:anti-sigma B factor antagonist